MARIEFINISHSYELSAARQSGRDIADSEIKWAVKEMNITWEDGTANALLGPSGCGKTTMLNIISGLLKPTEGQVLLDGKDVTGLPTNERHIAQVFQFPVVYDSMNVYNNLAFPLVNMGVSKDKIKPKVEETAELLGISDFLYSSTDKLDSAGKQKVSLGRGIIRENTSAILLDEPLTVIDPKLRGELRRSLKLVQQELKMTMIYVTHDQHEALTFADYVTIVDQGEVVQTDTPQGLYTEPATPFVGYFIGSPGMNVFRECRLIGEHFECADLKINLSENVLEKLSGVEEESTFTVGIRPEAIEIYQKDQADNGVPLKVSILENVGSYKILTLNTESLKLKCRVDENFAVSQGDTVYLNFPEEEIKIFAGDNQRIY